MPTASKRSVDKAAASKEAARVKGLPKSHQRVRVSFFGLFRRPRTYKYASYELQTDGVTTVLRVFEQSSNTEHLFPFDSIKEVRV